MSTLKKGICAASCTPMSSDGAVDYDALRSHLDKLIEAGVHIIAVNGGTGEFAFLSMEERRKIAEVAAAHINGRAQLIVQTSAIRTEDCIEASLHAEGVGADALLVLPPFFEGPVPDGVYYHYERIAEKVSTPLMVYNVPAHSGFDVTPEFFRRLSSIDNVKYIKDTSGDFNRVQELLASGATVFNGSDPFAFHALLAGCDGCFWGAVNAVAPEAVEMHRLIQSGDLADALEVWKRILPVNLFFWRSPYNSAVKAATNILTGPVGNCRKPVMPLDAAQMAELEAAIAPILSHRK